MTMAGMKRRNGCGAMMADELRGIYPRPVIKITVSGPVGCGKSAIAGEIEIAMKALGVPVQYRDAAAARSEKNMTGADWQSYLEMYQPMVTIVEAIERKTAPTRWQKFKSIFT